MTLWSQEVWSQGGCEAKSFHPRWWGQATRYLAARPWRWRWLEGVEKPAEPRLRAAGSSRGWGAVLEAWVWCREIAEGDWWPLPDALRRERSPSGTARSSLPLHTHTGPCPWGWMGSHIPSRANTPHTWMGCPLITPWGAAVHFSRCFLLIAPCGSFPKSSRQNTHLPKAASALRQGREGLVPQTGSYYSPQRAPHQVGEQGRQRRPVDP